MVVNSNAVIDPGAMVIIPFDALIADATVARSWSSHDLAIRTELDWVNKLKQTQKFYIFRFLDEARI